MDIHVIDGQFLFLAHCMFQSTSTGEGLCCTDPASWEAWNALPDSLVMRFNDEKATNS